MNEFQITNYKMKEEKKNLLDRIWKGEPLAEDFINGFSRPSEETRKKIFVAARKQAEQLNNRGIFSRLLFHYRGELSYTTFAFATAAIIVFVWLGTTGHNFSNITETKNQNWDMMVVAATTIAAESKISLLTEQSGVDIDEDIFTVELFLVDAELASLESEKWCDITFNKQGQL